jgi:heme oxygenase
MHAVIGRVEIKRDRADEALSMIGEHGVAMLQGMTGSTGGYWARNIEGDLIQHSFWLFDTEENARAAEASFNRLRDMPDAPAVFVSVDVCEIVGQA